MRAPAVKDNDNHAHCRTSLVMPCRELGGQMSPIWPDYYSECRAVIFVVDVGDNAALPPATVELYEAMQHPEIKVSLGSTMPT